MRPFPETKSDPRWDRLWPQELVCGIFWPLSLWVALAPDRSPLFPTKWTRLGNFAKLDILLCKEGESHLLIAICVIIQSKIRVRCVNFFSLRTHIFYVFILLINTY